MLEMPIFGFITGLLIGLTIEYYYRAFTKKLVRPPRAPPTVRDDASSTTMQYYVSKAYKDLPAWFAARRERDQTEGGNRVVWREKGE